jgi:hypothetical protein
VGKLNTGIFLQVVLGVTFQFPAQYSTHQTSLRPSSCYKVANRGEDGKRRNKVDEKNSYVFKKKKKKLF